MIGNIIGDEFDDWVKNQIKARQFVAGSGYGKSNTRNPKILNYLNNRNAWIKLASGVQLHDYLDYLLEKNLISYQEAQEKIVDKFPGTKGSNEQSNAKKRQQLEKKYNEAVDDITSTNQSTYNKGTQRLKDLQNFSTDGYFTENDIKSLDGIN